MLNLRSVDYDFKRVWFSKEADTIRASIKNKECHCPLANASYTNMLMHAPTLAKVGSQVAWQSLPIVSGRHGKDAAPVPAVTVTTVSGGPK
jgi:hypothetical protein